MFIGVLVLLAIGLAFGQPAIADVSETPVATACPASYELLSVASLEATGPYTRPRPVDSAGNTNGYVCGLVLPDSVRDAFCKQGFVTPCNLAQLGLPIYIFMDDDNPASQAAPNPPEAVDVTFDLPADFFAPGQCAFGVRLSLTGKGKTILLPGGFAVITSPGLDVTVTNLDTLNQVTLNVTGAFHQATEANGDVVTVVTWRNLLGDPEAGFVLAIGSFSFAFDAGGNLIQPLAGKGTLTDVCGLIE